MKLKKILEDIDAACTVCKECDPCCTWNVLKKCIKNERVILREERTDKTMFMPLVEA